MDNSASYRDFYIHPIDPSQTSPGITMWCIPNAHTPPDVPTPIH